MSEAPAWDPLQYRRFADERGRPLNLVHRDISPQNLLVGVDGVARVADFGVAKFDRKAGNSTTDGNLKGKLAYMAPEYLNGEEIDRRLDVFAMGVVLWEALTGQRLFRGQHEADTLQRVLQHSPPPISAVVPSVGTAFDAIVEIALDKSRDHRFDTAAAMGAALESSAREAGLLAGHREVAELVRKAVGDKLDERRALIRSRLADEPSVVSAMGQESPLAPNKLAFNEDRTTVPEPSPEPVPRPSATDTIVAVDRAVAGVDASRRSKTVLAVALAGGLLVAGGLVAFTRQAQPPQSGAGAPQPPAASATAAETPTATASVAAPAQVPAPSTSESASATARAGHAPRRPPPHPASPAASPKAAGTDEPPPNPYAPP